MLVGASKASTSATDCRAFDLLPCRNLLLMLPALTEALKAANSELLKAIYTHCSHPCFAQLRQIIDEVTTFTWHAACS